MTLYRASFCCAVFSLLFVTAVQVHAAGRGGRGAQKAPKAPEAPEAPEAQKVPKPPNRNNAGNNAQASPNNNRANRANRPGGNQQRQGRRGNRGGNAEDVDAILRQRLSENNVSAIDAPAEDPAKFVLGQALFFDRILSGNKDTACATCHHPQLGTGDGLALPVGTGTATVNAIGLNRVRGHDRSFIPRNAPEIFNRGSAEWTSQFWDSRIELIGGEIASPAGADLPAGLSTVLAAQAMFPVTSRDEMRGSEADALNGNELAAIDDGDLPAMWDALMVRLLAIPEYQNLFLAAFPGVQQSNLGFQHAAEAISVFEGTAYGDTDSPFDDYLRGDNSALNEQQKRGALLFYGRANCADCHSGPLLSDQEHHNIGIPQLGPGKDEATGLDFGRGGQTGDTNEDFKFRTPPLRNVAATGPYMHNGAYATLTDAVRHYVNPARALRRYNPRRQLAQQDLRELVIDDRNVENTLIETLDVDPVRLNGRDVRDLVAFLESLSVPNLNARLLATIPESVPSGLLEDGTGNVIED